MLCKVKKRLLSKQGNKRTTPETVETMIPSPQMNLTHMKHMKQLKQLKHL
jgi:hypothetical protein